MAAGWVLDAFNDFMSGTGTARLTTPDHPMHLANKHFYLWGRWWKNNGQPVDGGQNFTFWFLPKDAGTFEEVLDGTPTTPRNPQVLQKGVLDWRRTRAHSSWTDAEILLNDRVAYGTDGAIFEQFVKIQGEKDTIVNAAITNGLENQLSAVPDKSKMEGRSATTTSPYSLFAHVNESTSGLYGSGYTASAAVPGGVWTVKEAIDPTAASMGGQETPALVSYSSASPDDPANMIGGMDRLRMQIQWEQPDNLSKYEADDSLNNLTYLTSIQGRAAFMSLLRGDQDRYVAGPQDPAYPDPQFQGVPMKRWDALETAVIYDGASVLQTEGTAAGGQRAGPRVYAVNGNMLYPIAHRERLFYKDKVQRHLQVPDTWVQYRATWWNLVCKSFKHQGVLRPSPTMTAGMYVASGTGSNLY